MERAFKRTRRGGAYGGAFAFATSRGYASRVPNSILIARPRRRTYTRTRRPRMSSVKRQSIRTGGWHNPSRGGELKYIDTSIAQNVTFGVATFTAPQLLNGVIQGSDATNRIGRKINLKSIYVRGTWWAGPTSTSGAPLRVIIFYDKQANAAAPAATDLLLASDFTSPNNLNNRDRFVVIADQVLSTISNTGDPTTTMECYKKINLETLFNSGNAGTIGDITSGSLWIMFAQSGQLGTANGQFVYRARVRFDDL